jgi:alpha-beta hydrolase superfamily lysophospholipase
VAVQESEHFSVKQSLEGGIERVTVTPRNRRHETSILMQHGMWHGAWCWRPVDRVKTPLLWLAGEKDAVVTVEHERQSAAHYKADFEVIPGSAHNIMMEYNYRETAKLTHHWLEKHGIN